MLLSVPEGRQVVSLDLVEVGEDHVQLVGVTADCDALESGHRRRLHGLGCVVHEQHCINVLQLGRDVRGQGGDRLRRVSKALAIDKDQTHGLG